ncbi:MAG: hypothetical protein HXS43_08625 [Theionarchaea archaeon]|nr:hypothetical protein [Theionarchaea archaeon]
MNRNLPTGLAFKTGTSGFVILFLFLILGISQMRPAPDAELYIETDRGCQGQFTISEKTVLSFWMTGAAPRAEYLYWVRIYTESGEPLCGWRGTAVTDSAGTTSRIDIEHIISLPLGQQYAEVLIPELGLTSTCLLLVGGNTEIPPVDSRCYCEELTLFGIVDKEVVTPGDTLTLTVRVRNDMDCGMLITTQPVSRTRPCYEIQPLVVDLGALGGKVCPLTEERKVDSHATSDVAAYTLTVPYLTAGTYPINLEYALSYCTWAAYAQVDVAPSGTLSILSSPPVTKNREGSILLEVENPTTDSTTYTVVVTPPDGIVLVDDPIHTVPLAGQSTEQLTILFIAEKEGDYILDFTLLAGDTLVDETSASVQVTGFEGLLELESPPSSIDLNETVNLRFLVINTSAEDTTYTLSANVSREFTITGSLSVFVPAGKAADLSLSVTPTEKGSYLLTFDLFCEGDLVDSAEWTVTVAEGISPVLVATLAVTGVGAAFVIKSALSKHALTRGGESAVESMSGEEKAKALQKISEMTEEEGSLKESAELYERAADAWERINRIEQAAEIYKKGADIHEKLKNIKGALKDREKAALLYEKAAILAEEAGSYDKAASLLEKEAIEWQKSKKVDRAGQCFEKAAYLFNRAGITVHAREVQEMAARAYEDAAALGLKINELRASGVFYEQAGALYREAGNLHEASRVYRKTQDLWDQMNNPDKRRKIEKILGATYEEEAEKAEEEGDYERAALSHEKAADTWRKAGEMSRAAENEQKAMELYDRVPRD